MKTVQNVLVLCILLVLAAVGYQYVASRSLDGRLGTAERNVEGLEKESREHGEKISVQEATLGAHAKDIEELRKRMGDAEARLEEVSRVTEADRKASDENRAEIGKLRNEVDALTRQRADDDRRRADVEDLRKDLKRSQDRSADLERRLLLIEKRLGMERPQP